MGRVSLDSVVLRQPAPVQGDSQSRGAHPPHSTPNTNAPPLRSRAYPADEKSAACHSCRIPRRCSIHLSLIRVAHPGDFLALSLQGTGVLYHQETCNRHQDRDWRDPLGIKSCYTCAMTNIADQPDITATLRAISAPLNLTQEQLDVRLGVSFATEPVGGWRMIPERSAWPSIATLIAEDLGDTTGYGL